MSNRKQQAAPEFTTDVDGNQLCHVALANTHERATLYAEDYQRLMDSGFSRYWQHTSDKHGNAYPALSAYNDHGHNRLVTAARLLANADVGKRVRYADGNTLNLRKENLKLEDAPVWRGAAHWYPNTTALRNAGLEPAKRVRKTDSKEDSAIASPQATKADRKPCEDIPAAPCAHIPSPPRVPYTPHVRDVRALSARVQHQLAEQAREVTP